MPLAVRQQDTNKRLACMLPHSIDPHGNCAGSTLLPRLFFASCFHGCYSSIRARVTPLLLAVLASVPQYAAGLALKRQHLGPNSLLLSALGETFGTEDPRTGEIYTQVAEAQEADVDAAVKAAREVITQLSCFLSCSYPNSWSFPSTTQRKNIGITPDLTHHDRNSSSAPNLTTGHIGVSFTLESLFL